MNTFDKIYEKAKNNVKKIVLAESEDERTLQAIKIVQKEKYANIILIGNENTISKKTKKYGITLDYDSIEIIDPLKDSRVNLLAKDFF